MKMLRVFSGQLRQIHKKTESILNNITTDQASGMLSVANSFYNDEQFRPASDVYLKFLKRYPNSSHKNEVMKLYQTAKLKADRLAAVNSRNVDFGEDETDSSVRLP